MDNMCNNLFKYLEAAAFHKFKQIELKTKKTIIESCPTTSRRNLVVKWQKLFMKTEISAGLCMKTVNFDYIELL